MDTKKERKSNHVLWLSHSHARDSKQQAINLIPSAADLAPGHVETGATAPPSRASHAWFLEHEAGRFSVKGANPKMPKHLNNCIYGGTIACSGNNMLCHLACGDPFQPKRSRSQEPFASQCFKLGLHLPNALVQLCCLRVSRSPATIPDEKSTPVSNRVQAEKLLV